MANSAHRREDDDIDDFMASLIHREPIQEYRARRPKKQHKQDVPQPFKPAAKSNETPPISSHKTKDRSNSTPRRMFMLAIIFIVIVMLSIVLWKGPLTSFLQPRSPFSEEMRKKTGIPLYYPTKLPAGYKLELNTITQPETDVVLYAVSNESGQRFNITLQKQPADINLEPLYNTLTDTKEIGTQFGQVKVGTTTEGIRMANILAGQTWIIISGSTATLTEPVLAEVIDGLKF